MKMLGSTLAAAGAVLALAAPAGAQEVVADNLNNPRQLDVQPNGSVYVAEAGRGGGHCVGEVCWGFTSAMTRVAPFGPSRVNSYFISSAGPGGEFAGGMTAVAWNPRGGFVGIENGFFGDPSVVTSRGGRSQLGALLRFRPFQPSTAIAQIDDFEFDNNPAGDQVDSNPYGVEATKEAVYVADAGGNSLLRVAPNGTITTKAVFPDIEGRDAVPTSVRQGPDGALYVGTLVGEAAPEEGEGEEPGTGLAKVFRVEPGPGQDTPEVYADGLNSIVGLDFDSEDNLYVAEFTVDPTDEESPLGAVVRVTPEGDQDMIGFGELLFPGGVAIGKDDSIYVSNSSVAPAEGAFGGLLPGGQVVRYPPFEEAAR